MADTSVLQPEPFPTREMMKIKQALINENIINCKIDPSNTCYNLKDLDTSDTNVRFIKVTNNSNNQTVFLIPFLPNMKKTIKTWEAAIYQLLILLDGSEDSKNMEKINHICLRFIKLLCPEKKENFTYIINFDREQLSLNQVYFINRFFNNYIGFSEWDGEQIRVNVN